jgi:two-component system response regulator DegU
MLAVGDDPENRRFTTDEMQTLVLLAQQAGALLERSRGHAQRELLTVHRERARLARELHDGLAQNLASLLLKAELCNDLARNAKPELAEQIELLAEGIQQSVRETRAAISSLYEAPSDSESLMDALSLLAARFESQTGVRVALSWEGEAHRVFPPATRMALLRVAQEALSNVRKHACAQRVCAHLNATSPKTVTLSVHDDGCGFDGRSEDALEGAQRFGLRGMRERVEELGGSLRVDSTPGHGATVTALLPLVSLLIVDDHSLFRDGLRALLDRQDGLAVLGEAGDAETGIRMAEELRPDVILMDLHMPGRSGVEAIREIIRRRPSARIIALSMYQDAELVESVILAGARGYMLKDERAAVLVEGIRAVAQGGVAINPIIGSRLLDDYRRMAQDNQTPRAGDAARLFAPRELNVLELLAAGKSNRQIAEKLYLSEQTVKNLLTSIYHKLGAQNRTEAVLQAVQRGIVKPQTRDG